MKSKNWRETALNAVILSLLISLPQSGLTQQFFEDWETAQWGTWQQTYNGSIAASNWTFESGYNSSYSGQAKHFYTHGNWGGWTGLSHAIDFPAASLDLYYYIDRGGSLDRTFMKVRLHLSDSRIVEYWVESTNYQVPQSTDSILVIDCTGGNPLNWYNLSRNIRQDILGFSSGQVTAFEYGANSRGNGGGSFYGALRADDILLEGGGLCVTLTPHNPPIQIPAGGGIITFDAEIYNADSTAWTFDGWTEVVLPNGAVFGPLILRSGIPIGPGQTVMRVVTQNIPGSAPYGNYTYIGNAGNYPDSAVGYDSFDFAKLAGDGSQSTNQGWSVTGWFGNETGLTSISPTEYKLANASPNPFNSATTIAFTLPEAGDVTLIVCDVQGRVVVELANGWQNSGTHQVIFDGSGLASGIYFYKLTAGDYSATQKMVLVK